MPALSEEGHRFLDLALKVIAAVAFIAPLWFGYAQWTRTAELETRKPYLEKQLDACLALSDAAGTMATNPNSNDVAAATIMFEKLFWGRIAIFDNGPIYAAGEAFRAAANKHPQPDLRKLAEAIAHRCKDLLRASWNIR